MPSASPRTRQFLLGIFVLSGFTGLIYESIWSHYLQLYLGHAAYAQTLVLAIYMGGMAGGSWWIGRRSRTVHRLLHGYVLVEALIGLLGLLFHGLFVRAVDWSFATVIPGLPRPWLLDVFKWSLGSLLILPQSILLGMTFPMISGGLLRRWPDRPGETLALLYFSNSLGAAIGVLVSGFALIAAVGLPGTIRTAGALNLTLALAVWLSIRAQPEPAAPPESSERAPAEEARIAPLARWLTLTAFCSGAAAFMYELGWIRMLSLVLGSSTHSFELMLSAFILGLALGGWYVHRRIDRSPHPARELAWVLIATGTLAVLTLPAYNHTFDLMAWFLAHFARTPRGYAGFNLFSQLIAALIMIPATFCAGMSLPLLTHLRMRTGAGESAIGRIYAANTLGAIFGVLLATHLLMPSIGLKGLILAGAGIHVGLGIWRLAADRALPAVRVVVPIAASVAVYAGSLLLVHLDPRRMTSGVYRTGAATLPEGVTVEYLRDGKTATISLVEKAGRVTIATNGKPDAGIQMGPGEPSPDEVTMVLAAAVPLSMQPHPRRVANIGFGSGLTTHTLLGSDRVERLDSIEIEPFMVQAARLGYLSRIGNIFTDPRSHIIYDDAKTFLASAHAPYDLIVSEPSNPWVSGVATLFSDEFYARIAQYLTPDGYFAQWMQIYETNVDVVASVIKALAPHFGAYRLYNVDDVDMLIIATRAASLRAPDDALLQTPLLHAELERVSIQSVADIRARDMGDQRSIGPLLQAQAAPANSDYFPYVDLNAPRARYLRQTAIDLPALTVLPLPFFELLGGDIPRGPTAAPAAGSALFRDGLVQRALQIRAALASGDLNGLDPISARFLARLDAPRERCASETGQGEWREAVRAVSDATASYLSPAELEPIWQRVRAGPCYGAMPAGERVWADLATALAARHTADIARLGTAVLADDANLSADDRAYLTTLAAAAQLGNGQPVAARELLSVQWPGLNRSGRYGFALRDLRALAGIETPSAESRVH